MGSYPDSPGLRARFESAFENSQPMSRRALSAKNPQSSGDEQRQGEAVGAVTDVSHLGGFGSDGG